MGRKSSRSRKRRRKRLATKQKEDVEGTQKPSDFRIRDYELGGVLFKSLGFNIYMLQRKLWGDMNSIEDLRIDLGLKSHNSDSYDFLMLIVEIILLRT